VNSGTARCLVRPLFDGPCKKRRTSGISSHCRVLQADNAINFRLVPSRREFLMSYYIVYRLSALGNGSFAGIYPTAWEMLTFMGTGASNNMKLVHWPLVGGLLHLVQRGRDWPEPQPAQASPRCTKSSVDGVLRCMAAPVVWNSLPAHLRSPLISRGQFRAGFKTHLFKQAYSLWEYFVLRV